MLKDKFIGFLKSLRGGLKLATVFLPLVLSAGSLATGVTLGITSSCEFNDLFDAYTKTDVFAERATNDLDELSNQFLNKEISNDEFSEKLEYFSSSQYKKDLINENKEENVEFQPVLKQATLKSSWGLGLLLGGIVAVLVAGIIYGTLMDGFCDLADSAKDDIKDGYKEMFAKLKKDNLYKNNASTDSATYANQPEENSIYKEEEEKIESINEDYL